MTAPSQAGAVAWQVRYLDEVEGPGDWRPTEEEHVELYRRRGGRYEVRALYPFPPAAVPVEALEGLVNEMGEFLDAEYVPDLDTLQKWNDELTTLIKERSNGA